MIDVALLDLCPFDPPPERNGRLTLGSFAVEIGGVTIRGGILMEGRQKRWVLCPRCHHPDAEVRFSPALNRYLTRIVGEALDARRSNP